MTRKTSSWKEGEAPPRPELDIDLETLCFILLKARSFDVTEVLGLDEGEEPASVAESEDASNPSDDRFIQVLAAREGDPTFDELREAIDDLDVDQQRELVALVWLGRGDYGIDEWPTALETARDEHTRTTATSLYLLGTPLLADYLSEGLAQLGLSCEEAEKQHL